MKDLKRRDFIRLAALAAAAGVLNRTEALGDEGVLKGKLTLQAGGEDFSLVTGKERKAVPSACWQCVNTDANIGYVEDGRLMKIEGNPRMLSSGGRLCARGQAGVNQIYNPDRLLYPLLRAGRRGEGKWKRISWEEALDLLVDGGAITGRPVKGLRTLREEGTPEKYLFHYGRMTGSDWLINSYYFMPAYGSATIGDHNSICVAAGAAAFAFTGDAGSAGDWEDAKIILNFGSSTMEAGFQYLPTVRRCTEALARGAKMYVFDVRLSNTAAKATEWIPVKPATDMAVILSMCHFLMEEGLADEALVNDLTNVSVKELETHLAPYTPEWAEGLSGVPASKIRSIAREIATLNPALLIGSRGLFMHYSGVQAQRALYMLRVISGNVGRTGRKHPRPQWEYPFAFPRPEQEPKSLNLLVGDEGDYLFTGYHVSHQIVHRIDKGPERPEIYLVYCHNPVYSNGDCDNNARVYKDVDKIPFLVAVDVAMSETTELADLILPDATYLERWALESTTSPDGVPEYYIRQPMHPPLGEARNWIDVLCEIGERLGLHLGFRSAEEFVCETCENTPGVKEAGGFEYMKEHGVWHDRSGEASEYQRQAITLRSEDLEQGGFGGLPTWMRHPDHERMEADDLILTTFKVPVQTHSRTQGCKWLTELFHENPAWIHPETAAARGIGTGDFIRVKSSLGEITTRALVTEGVHPGAVAIAHHAGHWAWGHYASGKKTVGHVPEVDSENKWWTENGTHVNRIIPCVGDPIAGSMCWTDTVVKLEKA
jgi:anaerobic selenocysteine-containing dehydrogenase